MENKRNAQHIDDVVSIVPSHIYILVSKDGTYSPVEFVSNVYECAGIDVIQCNIRVTSIPNILRKEY